MNRSLAAVLVALAALLGGSLAACTSDADEPSSDEGAAPRPSTCDPPLDRAFRAWAEEGFSGSVAISTAGRFDCVAGYGVADASTEEPVTDETVFGIGSVTKAFTAAAVLHLVDDGRLSLDDRVGDVVPGLGGPVADATLRQLLLHTSGLTGSHGEDHRPLGHDEAVAAIGRLELAFPPGTDHLYSNAGYTLLALAVEAASGSTYRAYTVDEVLTLPDGQVLGGFWDGEPAAPGPRAVGVLDDGGTGEPGDFAGPHWALDGNGGLAMTTRELATWTRALFRGEIVSAASTEVIATPGVDTGDGTGETPGWVALDASILGEAALATAGGGGDVGHDAVVAWFPDSDRVVAMASNTTEVTAEELLEAVAPALLAGDELPRPTPSVGGVDAERAAATVGSYELPSGGVFDVSARDGRLLIAAHGPDAVTTLFPLSEASGFTARDVERHEAATLDLLAGTTQAGRDELEAVEADLGSIDHVEVEGTIVADGELRTYVTLNAGDRHELIWYALDDEGAVGAAEFVDEPPSLELVPDGDDFVPHDPTGTGPEVVLTFGDADLTVTGPAGDATVAAKAE